MVKTAFKNDDLAEAQVKIYAIELWYFNYWYSIFNFCPFILFRQINI